VICHGRVMALPSSAPPLSDNGIMSADAINVEELNDQAALALKAEERITETEGGRKRLLRDLAEALWAFAMPSWAMVSIVERAIDSGLFDRELFQRIHERLLPLERKADQILASAGERDYFNQTSTAAPLLALRACNERLKDCMVAVESMLDPQFDDIMAAALEEHRRGETFPLNSIS
jgi:hypothetical protein